MSETRKRRKNFYAGHAHKRQKRARELGMGEQGILFTCNNMNSRKSTSEALCLLNEYADELYGPEPVTAEEVDEDDVEVSVQKEVRELQGCQSRERRFSELQTGANNVLFIRSHGVEPERLVHHIMSDLHQSRKRKSRLILRMLPVGGTCRAFPEEMEGFLTLYLTRWFLAPRCATFQVCFKSRNNSHIRREATIDSVAELVAQLNQKNKVNLTNPELTIIVEIIKNICCVSVVRDYRLFRKYNLQELANQCSQGQDGTGEAGQSNQSSGGQEVKLECNQSSGEQEVKGESINQSSDEQEVKGESINQSSGEQEVKGESINQSSGEQEVKGESINQSSGEQEVKGESINQSSGEQEVKGESINQSSGEQEVATNQS